MKKTLLFTLIGGLALCSSAQLVVNPRGQLVAGKQTVADSGTSFSSVTSQAQPDSLSQIAVLGTGKDYSGGYLSFGNGSNVTIGEKYCSPQTWRRASILTLKGIGGIEMETAEGTVIAANERGARVNGDLQTEGLYLSSDSRLKSEVETIAGRTGSLDDISGVSYVLNTKASARNSDAGGQRTRFGFIAQEVKEYYPELVRTDEEGYMSVDYVGFIPLLLESVKELRQQVVEQQRTIDVLTAARKNVSASAEGTDIETVTASLSQNRPNPFTSTTTIECTLPETVSEADLRVYDLQGKQIMKLRVEGRGKTSVTIDGSTLSAGIYIYALIADGQEIDSKRMILTD